MSDQNTADNWRLEDTGNTGKQWKLQETEQNRISQWQLQDESEEDAVWQPVAYEREPRAQGGGWVLPSLVGLALIAVVAYGAWIGLTQFDLGNLSLGSLISSATFTPVATTDPSVTGPVAAAPTATTAAGAPTAAAETPMPPPTATLPPAPSPTLAPALVDLNYVRITNQYGVNARSEPSTAAEIVDLLEVDETFILQETQDEWLQVALSDGELAWISAEFAEQYTEQKSLAEANSELSALGLPLLTGPDGDTPVAPAVAATSTVTTTVAPVVTTTLTTSPTAPSIAGATITGTVNITAGLNARSAPDANAALVTLLPGNTTLTFTGRTAENDWLRTTVSNSITAWVFAEFVTLGGDANTLPVTGTADQESTAPITGTLTTTGTTTATPTPAVTAPTGATATVNTILGAGVRQAPSRDADAITTLPFDRVYSVLARSADDEWVQIALEADQQGWVLVSTVTLSVDLATLPVVVP